MHSWRRPRPSGGFSTSTSLVSTSDAVSRAHQRLGNLLHHLRPSMLTHLHLARLQDLVVAVSPRVHPSRTLGGTKFFLATPETQRLDLLKRRRPKHSG